MLDLPRITIVTPSYNQARYLPQAIESVLSQRYPNLEYFVFDGGSTDGTVDILRRCGDRLTKWVSERDAGQADAINKGFACATGEIVAFLNSDDYYFPGALHRVAEAFMNNPDAGIVYGRGQFVSEAGVPLRAVGGPIDAHRMIEGAWPTVAQPAVFLRRKVIETVGGLDVDLHYALDGDLFWRAFANFDAVFIPQTLAALRLQKQSKSVSAGRRFAPEILRMAEKLIANPAAYPRFDIQPDRVRSAAWLNSARFLYNNGLYGEAIRAFARSLRCSRRYAATIAFGQMPRLALRMILGKSGYDAAGRLLYRHL